VEFAKAKGVDMVAVGSRGMGSVKRSLMSLVGLGSVSDYVLHQLHVPVLVVHAGLGAVAAAAPAPAAGEVSFWGCCHKCFRYKGWLLLLVTSCTALQRQARKASMHPSHHPACHVPTTACLLLAACPCALRFLPAAAAPPAGVHLYGRLSQQPACV
jgi:hypothetical protein